LLNFRLFCHKTIPWMRTLSAGPAGLMPLFCLVAMALILSGWGTPVMAADMTLPLPVRNLDPVMMRFFDPEPDSALRPDRRGWEFAINQHYSTVNIIDNSARAQLLVDMELYVLEPVIRYAVNDGLDFTIRLPVLAPASGVFDNAIRAFHTAFGFPDNGRHLRPDNRFAYRFDNHRGVRWQGRSRVEMGNAALSGRYRLITGEGWGLAALAAVKLPTASKQRGWGSGAADIGIGAVASWKNRHWFTHLEGWVIQPLAGDVAGVRYDRYLRGSLTAGYQLFRRATLIVQLQGGNSPYNSGITGLDHPPFLIAFGLRGTLTHEMGWHAAVVENISQTTTQDISVTVGLNWSVE